MCLKTPKCGRGPCCAERFVVKTGCKDLAVQFYSQPTRVRIWPVWIRDRQPVTLRQAVFLRSCRRYVLHHPSLRLGAHVFFFAGQKHSKKCNVTTKQTSMFEQLFPHDKHFLWHRGWTSRFLFTVETFEAITGVFCAIGIMTSKQETATCASKGESRLSVRVTSIAG